ncbi:MAG: aminotransferase class I/II-fold pyridoxal phosphate-dependent enzyme [Phycisphaeraceae bacterium]|nr:aminotransferase class I/II-fold pyridoxal phosphate-dependent enzyme [Phycisphaeraceae bacterium]
MFDPQRFISSRAAAIDASGIRRVFDLAAKVSDPINLSIGQPDFDVPAKARDAAIEAIRRGHNRYTVTQGTEKLREAIGERFDSAHKRDGRWADRGMLITSGVSGALALALLATVGPGDKVLIGDPYFVMYKHLVRLAGAEPVFVDTYPDFRLTAERLEPHLDERTKLLLVSSPSNPTGVVLEPGEWAELVTLADDRNLLIVSDEIYDTFCYKPYPAPDGPRCPSPADLSDRVLILRGFSKTYAMTGWRLGYAVGPGPIIEQMTKLQQYTFVCAPAPFQEAAETAVDLDMGPQVERYRRRRDRVLDRLSQRYDLTRPEGAFYAFVKAPGGLSGSEFAQRAIERNLLIIPGSVFSEKDTHFRISYACEDQSLERGLDLLLELAGA